MSQTNNSRRSFLSTLAILTSGTLVAGTPSGMLNNSKAGNASLKKDWKLFLQQNNASAFLDITGKFTMQHQTPITGMTNIPGGVVSLPALGLLAQPSWIHWNKNSNLPDDVIIHFYETEFPYRRVKSINRFEMQALAKLPASSATMLAKALCDKSSKAGKKQAVVRTQVAKGKATQVININDSFNDTLFSDQYIYHI